MYWSGQFDQSLVDVWIEIRIFTWREQHENIILVFSTRIGCGLMSTISYVFNSSKLAWSAECLEGWTGVRCVFQVVFIPVGVLIPWIFNILPHACRTPQARFIDFLSCRLVLFLICVRRWTCWFLCFSWRIRLSWMGIEYCWRVVIPETICRMTLNDEIEVQDF